MKTKLQTSIKRTEKPITKTRYQIIHMVLLGTLAVSPMFAQDNKTKEAN